MHAPLSTPHTRPQPRDPKRDAQALEAKNLMRRKRVQLEHVREYDDAVVALRQKVRRCACGVAPVGAQVVTGEAAGGALGGAQLQRHNCSIV